MEEGEATWGLGRPGSGRRPLTYFKNAVSFVLVRELPNRSSAGCHGSIGVAIVLNCRVASILLPVVECIEVLFLFRFFPNVV